MLVDISRVGRIGGPLGNWFKNNAILDIDFVSARYRLKGKNYDTEAALLSEIGGARVTNGVQIGPNTVSGTRELLTNTTFDSNLNNWETAVETGSTAVWQSAEGGSVLLTSNGATGTSGRAGGAGILQQVTTGTNEALVYEAEAGSGSSSVRLGSTKYGAEGGSGNVLANTTVRVPLLSRGTDPWLYPLRVASGIATIKSASLKRAEIFPEFNPYEGVLEVSGTMPTSYGVAGVIATLDSTLVSSDLIRIEINTSGAILTQVRYQGVSQAAFSFPAITAGSRFNIRLAWKANEIFATLNTGTIQSDLIASIPNSSQFTIGRNVDGSLPFGGTVDRITLYPKGGFDGFFELTRAYRFEGDSFVGGAYSVSLPTDFQTVSGIPVWRTGLGGSTMEQIASRIIASSNGLKAKTTIVWDGDQNGITTVTEYCDILQSALTSLGHDRFVLIPVCTNYGQSDVSQEIAIRDEMI